MFLRALIVLLVVVNLGVAAWWATRAPPPTPAPVAQPAGVPRLQLLREAPRAVRTVTTPADATPAAPTQCHRFGPYASPAALRRAYARVLPQVLRAGSREVATGTASGWRVFSTWNEISQDITICTIRMNQITFSTNRMICNSEVMAAPDGFRPE